MFFFVEVINVIDVLGNNVNIIKNILWCFNNKNVINVLYCDRKEYLI